MSCFVWRKATLAGKCSFLMQNFCDKILPSSFHIAIWLNTEQISLKQPETTTTTIYFNEVVFPCVLGLTSPMAFPQHSPTSWPVPSIFPIKSLLSHIFFQHFSPSLPGPAFHSITIYLQCLNSLYPTQLISSLNMTKPPQPVSLHDFSNIINCQHAPHTHYFSFHLNSLLSSISTSSFHSSAFSLYPLSLLAMSHCHTTLQVLCMLYR